MDYNNTRPSLMTYLNRKKKLDQILEEDRLQKESRVKGQNYSILPPKTPPDTPPAPKTSYFVQHNTGKGDLERCPECGKEFKKGRYNQIYCSRECYHDAHVKQVNINYKRKRDVINRKRREKRRIERENRPPKIKKVPKPRFRIRNKDTLNVIRYKRDILIKAELVKKELLTIQVLSGEVKAQNKKDMIGIYHTMRHDINEERLEYIQKKLNYYDLPNGYHIPVEFYADPENDIKNEPMKWKKEMYFQQGDYVEERIANFGSNDG